MSETTSKTIVLSPRPINHFSTLDSLVIRIPYIGTATVRELMAATGVSLKTARAIVALRKKHLLASLSALQIEGLSHRDRERLQRSTLFVRDTRLAITNVVPSLGRVMSGKPYILEISFAAAPASAPVLARVQVLWAGKPFVVEKIVSQSEKRKGVIRVRFGKKQTLPTGPAVFLATIYSQAGAQAKFRTTCAVLPSNPFSLSLSPNSNFVTGTFSARGVRSGNSYVTAINVTLSNGDGVNVPMSSQFTWRFWDGGVGGSLVEQGAGDFGGSINVPPFGTWSGWVTFTSPAGSGIYEKYDGREDMTIEIVMTRAGGATVSGTITARTMFRFGLNITKVAYEDFTNQELTDLHDAVLVTQTIYQRRDVSFDFDNRHINRSDVGGFEIIDTDSEAHDLWNDWSGPDTNHNIDAFIVQLVAIPIPGDGTADGIDGSIPGPTTHAGTNSGVLASKSGFVDSLGHARLHVEYLGMLIGHEVGHYLGLSHTNEAGNLMLPSSGTNDTNLNYDPQYRTIMRHGWVDIS